ncbi:MAG: hypothetical protein ACUVRP_00835 [Chlorobiales bacterium]
MNEIGLTAKDEPSKSGDANGGQNVRKDKAFCELRNKIVGQ